MPTNKFKITYPTGTVEEITSTCEDAAQMINQMAGVSVDDAKAFGLTVELLGEYTGEDMAPEPGDDQPPKDEEPPKDDGGNPSSEASTSQSAVVTPPWGNDKQPEPTEDELQQLTKDALGK